MGSPGPSPAPAAPPHRNFALFARYFLRALRLRCPVCGCKPLFVPVRRLRRWMDWFQPLDGCPRCGLPYEREPGYFLLASLGFNPGFAVFLGLTIYLVLEWGVPAWCHVEVPVGVLVAATVLPMPVINLLVARHAKAFWLALDYFFDPHLPAAGNGDAGSGDWWDGGDDDDGNYTLHGPPSGGGGQSCWPPDEESAEDAAATGAPARREPAGQGAKSSG